MSDAGMTTMMKVVGDVLHYSTPSGIKAAAQINGPAAPVTGDPGWTSIKITQSAPNTLVETDYRDGKPIWTGTLTVDASGKRMKVEAHDLLRDRKDVYFALKQ